MKSKFYFKIFNLFSLLLIYLSVKYNNYIIITFIWFLTFFVWSAKQLFASFSYTVWNENSLHYLCICFLTDFQKKEVLNSSESFFYVCSTIIRRRPESIWIIIFLFGRDTSQVLPWWLCQDLIMGSWRNRKNSLHFISIIIYFCKDSCLLSEITIWWRVIDDEDHRWTK